MFKLKSVAVAVVTLATSIGAFADTFALGAIAVPSSTGLNTIGDLVNVIDGSIFTDTFTFSTSGSATISVALSNDAIDFQGDSLLGCAPLCGYEGAISGFSAKIDGTKVLTLTGPVLGNVGGYAASTLFLGLSQTFQIGAGAHTVAISGVTFNPGGSAYSGTMTLTAAVPVPEPETYVMMLAGLGALGFLARRRRQS